MNFMNRGVQIISCEVQNNLRGGAHLPTPHLPSKSGHHLYKAKDDLIIDYEQFPRTPLEFVC
jgi:hypothetical protein